MTSSNHQPQATANTESPETVRVRIAVLVDRLGQWVASGSSDLDESEVVSEVSGILDNVTCLSWIEADVPHQVPVIDGTVVSSQVQQGT
jgi:hypothetical protein